MNPQRISESALKRLARLKEKKVRREEGRFLVEGRRLVEEAVASPHRIVECVVEEGKETAFAAILERVRDEGGILWSAAPPRLARLAETVTPQGVVAVAQRRLWSAGEALVPGRAVAVLDGVSDPGNAGAILRSAWAFGLGGALFLSGTAELANPKTLRASMGGALHLPVVEGTEPGSAVESLRAAGFRLVAASPRGGEPAEALDWPERTAFLLGSEARGLSAELDRAADLTVSIGQQPGTESLNAAVAAGILFFLYRIATGTRPG